VKTRQYIVSEPALLLEYLLCMLAGQSRTSVKALLRNGLVAVNGVGVTKFDLPLKVGDAVEILAQRDLKSAFHHPMLKIVWADDSLIVVNKEEGLLTVQSSPGQTNTAFTILMDYVKGLSRQNRIYVLHRLDRGTSGLLMFARDVETQHLLRDDWHNMITRRAYIAVVEGSLPKEADTVVTYLAENHRQKVYCTKPSAGKEAITHYRCVKSGYQYTLVELTLETGRKNQIRAQMEYLGSPVAGDPKYGALTDPAGRLMLHAQTLEFIHPHTGAQMRFHAPAPECFYSII